MTEARPVVRFDPAVRFGEPQMKGIPTDAIAGAYWAGDSAAEVCDDYDLTRHEFLVVLWFEATRGDYQEYPGWKEWAEKVAYPRLAGWVKPMDVDAMQLPPDRGGDAG